MSINVHLCLEEEWAGAAGGTGSSAGTLASVMQQECLQWNLLSDRAVSNQGYQQKMPDQIHHRQEKNKNVLIQVKSELLTDGFQLSLVLQDGHADIPLLLGAQMLLPTFISVAGLCFLQLSIPRCSPKPLWAPPARVCHQQGGVGWEFVQRVRTGNSPSCPSAQDSHSWSLRGCWTQVGGQMS